MSFSSNQRNVRAKSGNRFPIDPAAETGALLADVIADALREDFAATPSRVKHLARLTGTNERTVQNWFLARNGPSGTALVVLMRHSDAVAQAVFLLAGRDDMAVAARLKKVGRALRTNAHALIECLGPE